MRQNKAMAARPSDLKLSNRMQILELFKAGTVYSVADIAQRVGISRQTVMKAIQFFLEKGIIVSDGKAASGSMGGKRAELFTLSADRCLFSVLICPDYLYVALFNFRCEVIDTFERDGIAELGVDEIIAEAGEACRAMLNRHAIASERLRGVCVSTSGIFMRRTGRLRYNSLFPAWGKEVPLVEKLAACFDEDVVIVAENVGKVCGSAYLHQREALNARGAAVFSSWGGVVACMMEGGRIVNGRDSLVGEIGHMTLAPDDPEVCGCGSRGCFERQVSAERLRAVAAREAAGYPESPLNAMPAFTIPDMFRASAAGDPLARRLSAYAADMFASALRNMTLMFNPEWVVFQGDYAWADDCFREELYRALNAFRYYEDAGDGDHPFALRTDTRSIKDLNTLGAYTLLIDRMFSDEATYS